MKTPKIPDNEVARLATLKSYQILDTPPEQAFDDIAKLAAQMLKVPVMSISFVDSDRQWFKATVGLDIDGTSRDVSFCAHTINIDEVMVVGDTHLDERFVDNPLVTGPRQIRFYAGAPLIAENGASLGALCALDTKPREFTEEESTVLRVLANQVMTQLTLRKEIAKRTASESLLRAINDIAPVLIWQLDEQSRCNYFNRSASTFAGTDLMGKPAKIFLRYLAPEGRRQLIHTIKKSLKAKKDFSIELRVRGLDQKYHWMNCQGVVRLDEQGRFIGLLGTCVDLTEQKNMQNQLRESQNFFSTIVNSLPVALYCKDAANGNAFALWNKKAEEILGFKAVDVIGKRDADLFSPVQAAAFSRGDDEVLESGKPREKMEFPVHLADLGIRWLHTIKVPVLDHKNEPRYLIGICEDITDKKHREKALFEETAKLELICSSIRDVIWMMDPVHDSLVYLNQAFEKVWGRPREMLKDGGFKAVLATVHRQDRDRVRRAFKDLTEKDTQSIFRIVMEDNSTRWLRARAFRIVDENGRLSSVVGLITDITESKRQELAILEQKEKFETLVNNIPVLIVNSDRHTGVDWVNEAWTKTLGWTVEDFTDRTTFSKLFLSKEQERAARAFMQAEGKGWYESEVRSKPGDVVHIRWERVIQSSEKSIIVGQDVTEERRQDAIIKAQQAAIVNSAKMSSLGEMAGGVAHEINNPLAIIHGLSESLLRNLDKENYDRPKLVTTVEKIKKTSQRIAKIVKGMKDFSRSSVQDPMDVVPVSALLEDTLEFCRERFRHHDVELREPAMTNLQILGRSAQISQILLNLFNNAFDAVYELPERWIQIEVIDYGADVMIKVTDSGAGIPSHVAEKIMDPFYTTKEVGKGTGLGLSIAKGLAESHNGQLFYMSGQKNTTFALSIPKAVPAGSTDPNGTSGEQAA